jgi:hypothetical protein
MKMLSETPLINFLLAEYNSVTYAHRDKGKFTQKNISYAPLTDVFLLRAAFVDVSCVSYKHATDYYNTF